MAGNVRRGRLFGPAVLLACLLPLAVEACSGEDNTKKAFESPDGGGGDAGSGGSGGSGGSSASKGGSGGKGGGAGTGGAGGDAGSSGGTGEGGNDGEGGSGGAGDAGAAGNAGAAGDGSDGAPGCTSPTTFSCAEFTGDAAITYDAASAEIVITLPEEFPKISRISADGDYAMPGADGNCGFGFDETFDPPTRVLRVPWPTEQGAPAGDLVLRNIELEDECDRELSIDPGSACLEPRLRINDSTGAFSVTCEDDPYDDDCEWSCG